MSNKVKLIVGLGNPEGEYTKTRHNAGMWLVNEIANKFDINFIKEAKFYGHIAKFKFNHQDIILLKPNTYMNLSGKSVLACVNFYKITPQEVLVCHDELDFLPGIVKLKFSGGNGGHNGLKDIDRVIGKDYFRLRIGIGHPGDKSQVSNFVLKAPSLAEKELIDNSINKALVHFELMLNSQLENFMKQLHTS